MEDKVQNILSMSMEKIVKDAILEIDIKGIMVKQIQKVTENIASNMFSEYSEFSKLLEAKVKSEISFNIDKISVPDFGRIAIASVEAELKNIEMKESEKFAKIISRRLNNLLLVKDSDRLTSNDLIETFAADCYENHLTDEIDSCQCDFREPEDYSDILELMEYQLDGYSFEFYLMERSRNWGSDWKACTSHLIMELHKDSKIVTAINLQVDREKQKDEDWEDGDYYKSGSDKINTYKIVGVEVDGKLVNKEGTFLIRSIRGDAAQKMTSALLNDVIIDCTDLSGFEIDSD